MCPNTNKDACVLLICYSLKLGNMTVTSFDSICVYVLNSVLTFIETDDQVNPKVT